ncbi:MAG: hypothetical protein ACK5ZC_12925 [Pirellulaceae bacterium]|jgi:hypothetical protein
MTELIPVAESLSQHLSLWAIRLAFVALFLSLWLQMAGRSATDRPVANLWLLGAILALAHSLGSLWSFHGGSQAAAVEATARQTEVLLGFRFGAGLYFNYLFVGLWGLDAVLRKVCPDRYHRMPRWYLLGLACFMTLIAFSALVVFKTGWIRAVGWIATGLLTYRWWRCRRARGSDLPKVSGVTKSTS